MSQQDLEIVVRLEQAMAKGDLKTAFADIDQDLVLYEPSSLPWGGTHRGHEAMMEAMQKLPIYWDFVGPPHIEARDAGDQIVMKLRFPVRSKKTGVSLDMEMVEFYKLVDGKVTEIKIFWYDTAAYLQEM